MTEGCRAGFVRFVTLRTGWLRSPSMRLVLPLAQHGGCNLDATVNRQQNPLSKAGCEQAKVLSGGHNGQAMGMRAQIGAQPGAFRNSEGAVARPDTVTCQDGGATDTTRK